MFVLMPPNSGGQLANLSARWSVAAARTHSPRRTATAIRFAMGGSVPIRVNYRRGGCGRGISTILSATKSDIRLALAVVDTCRFRTLRTQLSGS